MSTASPASPRLSTSLSRIACAIANREVLALAHVGQEGDLARPLHRERELLLMAARQPRDPARADLAAVGDEAPQGREVLVVDLLDVDAGVLAGAEAVRAARASAPCPRPARSG